MFTTTTGELYKKAYRISLISLAGILTDENLWVIPHPEYIALNYPDMVLSIIQIELTISLEQIREILQRHNIPTDLGFLLSAILDLKQRSLISEPTKYNYKILE